MRIQSVCLSPTKKTKLLSADYGVGAARGHLLGHLNGRLNGHLNGHLNWHLNGQLNGHLEAKQRRGGGAGGVFSCSWGCAFVIFLIDWACEAEVRSRCLVSPWMVCASHRSVRDMRDSARACEVGFAS